MKRLFLYANKLLTNGVSLLLKHEQLYGVCKRHRSLCFNPLLRYIWNSFYQKIGLSCLKNKNFGTYALKKNLRLKIILAKNLKKYCDWSVFFCNFFFSFPYVLCLGKNQVRLHSLYELHQSHHTLEFLWKNPCVLE